MLSLPATASRAEVFEMKLKLAFESSQPFPIDLDWMVELFKYKHISSLTTHLKRHFKEKKEFLRKAEGQNKKSWRYLISVECFRRICHFCRHTERKVVAKQWLKILAKQQSIRTGKSNHDHVRRERGYGLHASQHTYQAGGPLQQAIDEMDDYTDEDTDGGLTRDEDTEDDSGVDREGEGDEDEDEEDAPGRAGCPSSSLPATTTSNNNKTTFNNHTNSNKNTTEPTRDAASVPTTTTSSSGTSLRQQQPPAAPTPNEFKPYLQEWNYLGLAPVNHYMLSIYYSHPNYFVNNNNHRQHPVVPGTFNMAEAPAEDADNNITLDSSFDTNAFLSFDTEEQPPAAPTV